MDARLKQVKKNKTQWFGGFSLMIVGDFAQLPPVCGNIAYIRYETSSEIEKIGR